MVLMTSPAHVLYHNILAHQSRVSVSTSRVSVSTSRVSVSTSRVSVRRVSQYVT